MAIKSSLGELGPCEGVRGKYKGAGGFPKLRAPVVVEAPTIRIFVDYIGVYWESYFFGIHQIILIVPPRPPPQHQSMVPSKKFGFANLSAFEVVHGSW